MRKGWLGVFSTLAIGLVWLAPPLRAQFVYVANHGDNTVSAYSIAANGALSPVKGSPFAAGNQPTQVAVDPNGRFAYVTNLGDNTVSAYGITADGALTPVKGSPFAVEGGPNAVAVDPTGKFAYVINNSENAISAYSIGADGALKLVTSVATGNGPISVAVDPTGKFVYEVNSIFPGTVWGYRIGANGAPTMVTSVAAGNAPFHLAVDPTGKFVYVPNYDDFDVSAYRIGNDGSLTPVPGSPFGGELDGPFAVAVDPTGRFAYVADFIDNTIAGFTIGADGSLTEVPGSLFGAGNSPGSLAVDPTGKFVYVANYDDNTISAYRIAANGDLTQLTTSPFAAGSNPNSVAITPFVPFASSFAKLEIDKDSFDLRESFTLGATSHGIKPHMENVTLQIGTFSTTIPAGSFKMFLDGTFTFFGVIDGVNLEVQIVSLGNKMFTFTAKGAGVDLTGLINPVTVVLSFLIEQVAGGIPLQIINSGTTTVTAQFQ